MFSRTSALSLVCIALAASFAAGCSNSINDESAGSEAAINEAPGRAKPVEVFVGQKIGLRIMTLVNGKAEALALPAELHGEEGVQSKGGETLYPDATVLVRETGSTRHLFMVAPGSDQADAIDVGTATGHFADYKAGDFDLEAEGFTITSPLVKVKSGKLTVSWPK